MWFTQETGGPGGVGHLRDQAGKAPQGVGSKANASASELPVAGTSCKVPGQANLAHRLSLSHRYEADDKSEYYTS